MDRYPVVMTIAGSDSGGGAGIQADLKTFAALGIPGTCAVTSITSQNTAGVLDIYDLPPGTVASQIRAIATDMEVAYAKTGMLSSQEIITTVAGLVQEYCIPLVVDPVMAAEVGGSLLKSDALETLQTQLIPLCQVVTPNVQEARHLSGIKIHNMEDAKKAAQTIVDKGANAVIITGGHLDGSDLLFDGENLTIIEGELVKGGTHGAGCTYSAALTVFLAKGASLRDAATGAKLFVTRAILESRSVGRGAGPVDPTAHTLHTAHMFDAVEDVRNAIKILEASKDFAALIPEVGCNIVSALPEATSPEQVCGITGRIVRLEGRPQAVGCPAFGASRHVARVVLAAMHHDKDLKGAVNIRYSPEILQVVKAQGLTTASFDRKHEPNGVSTMEWGTSTAIEDYRERHNRVPDAVYDLGAVGKEPMIRLLAPSAVDAASRAVKIAQALAVSDLNNSA